MLRSFPYTIIPFLIFNLIALAFPSMVQDGWAEAGVLTITLFSGELWTLSAEDLMIIVGLAALFVEMVRATSIVSIGNHLLSVIVLIAYVIEFFVVKQAGNSTFFVLSIIALIDVLAGIAVTIRQASRDISFQGHDPTFHP